MPVALSRFLNARNGNVAPLFGVAIVPLLAFVGAALDYSRAVAARTSMQDALDATALMLSKEASGLDATQLSQKATTYFNALYSRPEAKNIQITTSYTKTGSTQLKVTGNGTLDTSIMKALGIPQMTFSGSSTVTWGSTKLRVALALDNTGSMASAGKMAALKTATHQLLTVLQTAASSPGDVQVSLVPFAKDVNVGASRYNADWLDWSDWDARNQHTEAVTTCTSRGSGNNQKCTTDDVSVPNDHRTWNGCVTDRNNGHDVKNTPPDPKTPPTLFSTEQDDACPQAIQPLTYNWSTLNTLVDQMQPAGSTNQPIGLVWAWQTLSSNAPFNVPPPPSDTSQIIILLSDGLNTQDRWHGDGRSVSKQVDARMALVCANAKSANIQIYTVQVNTDRDPQSSVLKNCATKPESMFFELKTAGAIVTTFNQIGTDIAKLRIAQ